MMSESGDKMPESQKVMTLCWKIFLKTPSRKSEALTQFLSTLWLERDNPDLDTWLNSIGERPTLVNQLAREFMSDIHHICSQTCEEEDSSQLETYLLSQRGWMFIYAIKLIGLQGLSCNKELAFLVVSLIQMCQEFRTDSEGNENSTSTSFTEFEMSEDVFVDYAQSVKQNDHKTTTAAGGSGSHRLTKHRATSQGRADPPKVAYTAKSSENINDSTDSDEGNCRRSTDLSPRNHKWRNVHIHAYPDAESDDEIANVLSQKVAYIPPLRPFSLCHLFLDLLKLLCDNDKYISTPSKLVSLNLLPQMLLILENCNQSVNLTFHSIFDHVSFHTQVVHVILSASAITLTQQNGINIILSHKTIPRMFKVIMYMINQFDCENFVNHCDDTVKCVLKFVYYVTVGVLILANSIFQYLSSNLILISSAVVFMTEFEQNKGYKFINLLVEFVVFLDELNTPVEFSQDPLLVIINVLCRLIDIFKIAKVNYIHVISCLKEKHRKCDYSKYLHHHHNITGLTGAEIAAIGPALPTPHLCIIAVAVNCLYRLLTRLRSKHQRLQVIAALNKCGVCCCMPLADLVSVVVDLCPVVSVTVRNRLFVMLDLILFEQLYAGEHLDNLAQKLCRSCVQGRVDSGAKTAKQCSGVLDSGISSNEERSHKSVDSSVISRRNAWQSLELFRKLAVDNKSVCLATVTVKNLALIASKGNCDVQGVIFQQIFLPLFLMFQTSMNESDDSAPGADSSTSAPVIAYSVIYHVLTSLPFVLQDRTNLRIFHECQGFDKLLSLLDHFSLRFEVLSVIEAMVVLEEKNKILKSVAVDSHSSKMENLVSKSFVDILINKSAEYNVSSNAKTGLEYDETNSDSDMESMKSKQTPTLADRIHVLTDLWSSCKHLCMTCTFFLRYFVETASVSLLYEHLHESLSFVSNAHNIRCDVDHTSDPSHSVSPDEIKQRLGLLEHLLSLCFYISSQNATVIKQSHSFGYIAPDSQPLLEMKLRSTVEQSLIVCLGWDLFYKRLVCDMLLSSASVSHISPVKKPSPLVAERDAVEEMCDESVSSSDDSSEVNATERGYETDNSSCSLSSSKPNSHDHTSSDWHLLPSAYPGTPITPVPVPTVYHILVKLLVLLDQQEGNTVIVQHVFNKLIIVCKESELHRAALSSQGILEVILHGFETHITMSNSGELHESVLEIVQLLSQQDITTRELQLYLRCFLHTSSPVVSPSVTYNDLYWTQKSLKSLLLNLIELVESYKMCSHHFLKFPAVHSKHSGMSHGAEKSFAESPQSLGALHQGTPECLPWHTYQITFSASLWLWYDEKHSAMKAARKDTGQPAGRDTLPAYSTYHVMSLGNTEKQFEVWLNTATGSIIIRLTSELYDSHHTLKEFDWSGCVTKGTWHHVMLMYSEWLDGSTLIGKPLLDILLMLNVLNSNIMVTGSLDATCPCIQMTMVIDGCDTRDLILDHPALQLTSLCPGLTLGHVVTETQARLCTGELRIGNLMIFKGSNFDPSLCFHLFALGPNAPSITKCDCNTLNLKFAPALMRKMVRHSAVGHEILVGSKTADIQSAQESLIISHSPQYPQQICHYKTVFATESSSNSGTSPSSNPEKRLLAQKPIITVATTHCSLNPTVHRNLEQTVADCGGVGIFLFLIAKVVEGHHNPQHIAYTEVLQSQAVKLLFTVLDRMPRLLMAFESASGYAMLSKVLVSHRAVIGFHTLKVVLDAATSESLIRHDRSTNTYVLRQSTEAVVKNCAVVAKLLLAWRIWEKGDERVTQMLFQALEMLVDDGHPWRDFNVRQFLNANIIDKMFLVYEERIQENMVSLHSCVSLSVIRIIERLVGSPPDLHTIMSICDFLLILHPAASTYVYHERQHFYFSLWWALIGPTKPSRVAELRSVSQPKRNISISREYLSATDTPVDSPLANVGLRQSFSLPSMVSMAGDDNSNSDTSSTSEAPINDLHPQVSRQSSDTREMDDTSKVPKDVVNPAEREPRLGTENVTNDVEKYVVINDDYETMNIDRGDSEIKHNGSHISFEVISEQLDDTSNVSNDLQGGLESHCAGTCIVSDERFNPDETRSSIRPASGSNNLSSVGRSSTLDSTEHGIDSDVLDDSSMKNALESSVDTTEATGDGSEAQSTWMQEKGVNTLCAGLLDLVSGVVLNLPDSMVERTLTKIVRPEVLIILAHNPCNLVRAAVIKVIDAYLKRASTMQQDYFMKKEYFHLVSLQLHQYNTREGVVNAVISLLVDRTMAVDESLDSDMFSQLSNVGSSALVMLVSLIEKTAEDVTLCHNLLALIAKMLESSINAASSLIDLALVETLCNLLATLNAHIVDNVASEGHKQDCLYMDVQYILCLVALREFSVSGASHYHQCEDLITLVKCLEHRETHIYGRESRQALYVRCTLTYILKRLLDYCEMVAEDRSQPMAWFKSQTSYNDRFECVKSLLKSPFAQQTLINQPDSSLPTLTIPDPQLTNTKPATPTPEDNSNFRSKISSVLEYFADRPDFLSLGTLPEAEDFIAENSVRSPTYSVLQSQDEPVVITHSMVPTLPSASLVISTKDIPLTSRVPTFFRAKKRMPTCVTQSELIDRLKKILPLATDLIVFADEPKDHLDDRRRQLPPLIDSSHDVSDWQLFQRHLLLFLYKSVSACLEKGFFGRSKNVVMSSVKDVTKQQLSRLILTLISPRQSFVQRIFTLSYLCGESQFTEVFKMLLTNQTFGVRFGVSVYELLTSWKDRITTQQYNNGCGLISILRQASFSLPSTLKPIKPAEMTKLVQHQESWNTEMTEAKSSWWGKVQLTLLTIHQKHDGLMRQLSANAMETTQLVTQLQKVEREKFVNHVKKGMTIRVHVKKLWQDLVQQLTHERAVWYIPESYPSSWQVDPTEGPARVRRRLQRSHLHIHDKFVLPAYQHRLHRAHVDPPLLYLFEDNQNSSDSAALIYRLYTNEKIQNTYKCTAVMPANESTGDLFLGEHSIYFVADEAVSNTNYTQVLLGNKDQLSMTWPHVDIKEIHKRWYQLRDIGLEIFLTNGKTCLLAFDNCKDRDELLQNTLSLELPNLIQAENILAIEQLWLDGRITNYEYLMQLNKMAGRSFNDLMQYPILPFILSEYKSSDLDLNSPTIYRDLSRPVAVQHKSREEKYCRNYEYLASEFEKGESESLTFRVQPYHYGSHYSNSGTVLQFMVRLPPYTQMFISYQDNSFDLPDRTFHSLETSWRLASYESPTDVKELIPEFFYLPEFLMNTEGFDFGRRQSGEPVSEVMLPPWSHYNPRLFVLIHRQALESQYVSQQIHHWIDLVFGYKQSGELAVQAINVFHPSTYFGTNVESIKDPVKRTAIETMIKTYGQTPKQLFRLSHPSMDTPQSGTRTITNIFLKQTSQSPKPAPQISPLFNIEGLSWGNYIGSPDLAAPVATWQKTYEHAVASLVALPTGDVFGIATNACLLVMYSKERGLLSMNSTNVVWAAIVSWGHEDNILRVRNRQDRPTINFIHDNPNNQVHCCASVPDCRLLFMGGSTGVISVYTTACNVAKESDIQVFGLPKCLYGHHGAINCIQVCKAYSVLVSGSDDKTCIIWDLNKLTYVRSIDSHKTPVRTLAVSETLGDIASVSDHAMGSCLQLHTINGEYVTKAYVQESVLCLAYSTAPEGRSVNIIAGGLSSGAIRMWSSWDLQVVRDVMHPSLASKPVVSLTFTPNSQRLYASTANGTVTIWEVPQQSPTRWPGPMFIPFL